jgi:DNA polymerase-1
MSDGPKLLLIDGTNLCFREYFAPMNLKYKGRMVDVIFGGMKSLISYHKQWPDHFRIVCWEGGYARRLAESEAGVERGIIPASYKQNRRDKREEPDAEDLTELFEQMDIFKDMLDKTRTLQVRKKGFEADDVINSYADWARRHGGEAVIVSSDKDFLMCINEAVRVFDARAKEMWDLKRFQLEFTYNPELWVDKGAIEGEVGPSKDNIFGVDGWGPVTASKYVTEHGGIDAILEFLKNKPENKRGKKEQTFIEQEERLRLAKSLKTMDIVPDLPMPRIKHKPDEKAIKNMFLEYGFASILKEAWRFV